MPAACKKFLHLQLGQPMLSQVDPLSSILAVLARSCQILTTSWQPWIPWQDSYQDLTKIILIPRSYLITMDKILGLQKNSIPSVQAAETQSKGSIRPTTTISTRFHNQNA